MIIFPTLPKPGKRTADVPISMSCCCSIDLVPATLLERLTMGPDIMPLLLLYSMLGRIMEGWPAELTGLALERGMPQSPDAPIGDLWGTMPLFIGPDKNST